MRHYCRRAGRSAADHRGAWHRRHDVATCADGTAYAIETTSSGAVVTAQRRAERSTASALTCSCSLAPPPHELAQRHLEPAADKTQDAVELARSHREPRR